MVNQVDTEGYEGLVWPIALSIYFRCEDHGDGVAEFEHLGENDFDLPSDMLARLGMMRECDPGRALRPLRHTFRPGWTPAHGLQLQRHRGEPTVFDLIAANCFFVSWDSCSNRKTLAGDGHTMTELPRLPDITANRRSAGPDRTRFAEFAFRLGASQLSRLGLGAWRDGGGFDVIDPLSGNGSFDLIDTYQYTRGNLISLLGSKDLLYPPK